jgi:hypothetical protein
MRISKVMVGLAAATLMLIGCAKREAPATQALASSEAALSEVRADATKYAPKELESADDHLAKLKEKLAKEDYKDVLLGAQQLDKEVALLKEVVVSKQTQLVAAAHEWEDLSVEVPKMVDAIQSRVDSLSSSALPKDVKKESFEAAKSGLESIKSLWAEASAAFTAGNAALAADKARAAQAKGAEVSKQLGMTPA